MTSATDLLITYLLINKSRRKAFAAPYRSENYRRLKSSFHARAHHRCAKQLKQRAFSVKLRFSQFGPPVGHRTVTH
jgi:hypothetical protein